MIHSKAQENPYADFWSFLCLAASLLVLCPQLPAGWASPCYNHCLISSVRLLCSTWILSLCSVAWNMSPIRKLGQSQSIPCLFPFSEEAWTCASMWKWMFLCWFHFLSFFFFYGERASLITSGSVKARSAPHWLSVQRSWWIEVHFMMSRCLVEEGILGEGAVQGKVWVWGMFRDCICSMCAGRVRGESEGEAEMYLQRTLSGSLGVCTLSWRSWGGYS